MWDRIRADREGWFLLKICFIAIRILAEAPW